MHCAGEQLQKKKIGFKCEKDIFFLNAKINLICSKL